MTLKKIIITLLLLTVYFIVNEEAFLYDKQITPVLGSYLPFGFTVNYYETKYHLRDNEKAYFIIYSGHSFPTSSSLANKEKIKIKSLNAIYWTKDRLIANVSTQKGIKLIEIKDYVSDGYVSDYDFVSYKRVLEMDNMVAFNFPPTLIKYWRIIGVFYWIGIVVFLFKSKLKKQ